jgi:small GTP-binding protein
MRLHVILNSPDLSETSLEDRFFSGSKDRHIALSGQFRSWESHGVRSMDGSILDHQTLCVNPPRLIGEPTEQSPNVNYSKSIYRFPDLQMSGDPDFEFTIVLVGDCGVGKTNLRSRFAEDRFTSDSQSTLGFELVTKTLEIGGKTVKTQILDTAGEGSYRTFVSAYYRGAAGVVLVYDVTNPSTFQSVTKWFEEIREYADPNISILVVGNKCDLQSEKSVSTTEGHEFATRESASFMETSALDGTNVNESFAQLVGEIVRRASRGSESADPEPEAIALPPKEERPEVRSLVEKEGNELKLSTQGLENVWSLGIRDFEIRLGNSSVECSRFESSPLARN